MHTYIDRSVGINMVLVLIFVTIFVLRTVFVSVVGFVLVLVRKLARRLV